MVIKCFDLNEAIFIETFSRTRDKPGNLEKRFYFGTHETKARLAWGVGRKEGTRIMSFQNQAESAKQLTWGLVTKFLGCL